ncbi:hypothetical protein NFC79_18955 [Providencia stuartii]|nr:hypothetical protein NFC79_18955 [Providencia stuartii]
MEINFKNNNAKYERISELMQSVENRLNKMDALDKSIDNDFNKIIKKISIVPLNYQIKL